MTLREFPSFLKTAYVGSGQSDHCRNLVNIKKDDLLASGNSERHVGRLSPWERRRKFPILDEADFHCFLPAQKDRVRIKGIDTGFDA